MDDKNWVGMSTCFFCGEVKELLLDRRMRKSLPHRACYNHEPCPKCAELMQKGIILISVKNDTKPGDPNPYRTGRWVVVSEDAIKRIFAEDTAHCLLKGRFAFMSDDAMDEVGLTKEACEAKEVSHDG